MIVPFSQGVPVVLYLTAGSVARLPMWQVVIGGVSSRVFCGGMPFEVCNKYILNATCGSMRI